MTCEWVIYKKLTWDIAITWERRQNSLPLVTNFSQNITEPSKGISYPVSDLCWRFTKLTGSSDYTLHNNPMPPTDGTNGLLSLVAYISQTGHQCFPACFCHPTVRYFGVSPYWQGHLTWAFTSFFFNLFLQIHHATQRPPPPPPIQASTHLQGILLDSLFK